MMLGFLFFSSLSLASPQALWTPIYVDSTSQVDLWTQSAEGCKCSFDTRREDCACCVEEGGCHCGEAAPHRCAQCGIQHHCTNMCNMTIDASVLVAKSGKTFGQIKSPSMQGPTSCWFTFIPDVNHRIEIQIYRLISIGKFNGTACEHGFVQLVEGVNPVPRNDLTQICGANERFQPPVLLFSDKGPGTLIVKMDEITIRSQIMAYFSFTSAKGNHGAGFQPFGGRKLENTECDWAYDDLQCQVDQSPCALGSPGFPGVYQPNRRCYYYLTTSSPYTSIDIEFKVVHLPHGQCETDFIKVHNGSTSSSPLIATLCGNKRQRIVSNNGIFIEFSSGPPVHPFDYNGFVASVVFFNTTVAVKTSEAPVTIAQHPTFSEDRDNKKAEASAITFYGNESRSGHFDSRSHQCGHNCSFFFIGKPNDVIHLTLLNYHLRAPSCQTTLEIFDGRQVSISLPMKYICSPIKKHSRDSSGSLQLQDTFLSTKNTMSLFLKRSQISSHSESEFVDGAFLFHNEHLDGTLQPDTVCDVGFYGLSSNPVGEIRNPGLQHLFWNSPSPIRCVQKFVPATNQSITLKIVSLNKLPLDKKCQTACGDSGCRCLPTDGNLNAVNHLILSSKDNDLSCLCGDFQQEWLPVGIRSWSPTSIIYSVAHSVWNKGFHYQAEFTFHSDISCGHQILNQHSGHITSIELEESTQLNYYYYQSCTWVLDSNVLRQLTVDIESDQNRPCTSWNITLHEYGKRNPDKTGKLLYTFCPRSRNKTYALPWEQNIIVIRLNAMTRILPSFTFRWRSQITRSNTRASGVVPAQSSRATVISLAEVLLVVTFWLFL
nr:uncharacterized protein LOC106682048 [Halyomorpha halys]